MPTYDYRCEDCGKAFDVRASIAAYSEGLKPECPECGSEKTKRGFSVMNVLFGSSSSSGSSSGCAPSGFG